MKFKFTREKRNIGDVRTRKKFLWLPCTTENLGGESYFLWFETVLVEEHFRMSRQGYVYWKTVKVFIDGKSYYIT